VRGAVLCDGVFAGADSECPVSAVAAAAPAAPAPFKKPRRGIASSAMSASCIGCGSPPFVGEYQAFQCDLQGGSHQFDISKYHKSNLIYLITPPRGPAPGEHRAPDYACCCRQSLFEKR